MHGMLTLPPKTLAIDYGLARVGLAVSHGTLAEPLVVLANTSFDELVVALKDILVEEHIKHIIVGISAREMAEITKSFVAELRQHISVPISLADEAYSTKAAAAKLYASSATQQRKKGPVDHYAAAEFLQEWLEEFVPETDSIK
jgi:putative transcription antitermination factor YqgF